MQPKVKSEVLCPECSSPFVDIDLVNVFFKRNEKSDLGTYTSILGDELKVSENENSNKAYVEIVFECMFCKYRFEWFMKQTTTGVSVSLEKTTKGF